MVPLAAQKLHAIPGCLFLVGVGPIIILYPDTAQLLYINPPPLGYTRYIKIQDKLYIVLLQLRQ